MWDPYGQSDIKTLDQVQCHAARYVFNDYHFHPHSWLCNWHDLYSLWTWVGKPWGLVLCVSSSKLLVTRTCIKAWSSSILVQIIPLILEFLALESSKVYKEPITFSQGINHFFQECNNSVVYCKSFFPRTIREWNILPSTVTSTASERASLLDSVLPNHAEVTRALFVNSFTVFHQCHGTTCFYPPCLWSTGTIIFHLVFLVMINLTYYLWKDIKYVVSWIWQSVKWQIGAFRNLAFAKNFTHWRQKMHFSSFFAKNFTQDKNCILVPYSQYQAVKTQPPTSL